MAFLAIAALAVVSVFAFSARLHNQEKHRHEAALIAFDSMEEVRVLLRDTIASDVVLPPTPHPELSEYTVERTQAMVDEDEGVLEDSLKEVVVIVTWEDSGQAKSFRLMERFCRQ